MRLRSESGVTIVELVLGIAIGIAVLAATLDLFNTVVSTNATANRGSDAVESTRQAIDGLAHQLRNLANPTASGSSIDRATSYEFVFQTGDPVKRRVRYCLASSSGGTDDVLWYQTATASIALTTAMLTGCPASGWTSTSVVVDDVVNRIDGADRPVFTFGCSTSTPAGQSCTSSSALFPRVLSARVDLYLDVNDYTRAPGPTRMSTVVYLRNQNEPPTASFATPSFAGPRTVVLNASASDDPEGRTMEYQWFKGTGDLPAPACAGGPVNQGTIGTGVTLTYVFPASDGSSEPLRLRVVDPGCLTSVAGPVTVSIQ